jgi:hypothetical protein
VKKDDIIDKLEEMWDEAQANNIGSGESELEFKENVADWIYELYRERYGQ